MKKIFLLVLFFLLPSLVYAETFNAKPGSEMRAVYDSSTHKVTLTWSGIDIAFVEQYQTQEFEGKWIGRHKATGKSATFNAFIGDRFNVINKSGQYLMLTPEMAVAKIKRVKLSGISIKCSNSKGCVLQVDPDVP